MPLVKSSSEPAFKQNVRTLMGEIGKSPHVKDRSQALAIAYATKRRGRKSGGRTHFDPGGFVNPAAAPVSGPQVNQMAAPPPAPTLAPPQPTMPAAPAPTLGPMQTTPPASTSPLAG